MTELTGIIPSTDNLFKFLFIGGLLMVFTAMFYPMQKRQQLDIEINSFNKDVDLINNEIDAIEIEVKELKLLDSTTELSLTKLKQLRDKARNKNERTVHASKFATTKSNYFSSYNETHKKLEELKIKNIILSFNKNKISLLKNHANEYGRYTFWLLIFGIPFGLIGIAGWGYSTYITTFKSP